MPSGSVNLQSTHKHTTKTASIYESLLLSLVPSLKRLNHNKIDCTKYFFFFFSFNVFMQSFSFSDCQKCTYTVKRAHTHMYGAYSGVAALQQLRKFVPTTRPRKKKIYALDYRFGCGQLRVCLFFTSKWCQMLA